MNPDEHIITLKWNTITRTFSRIDGIENQNIAEELDLSILIAPPETTILIALDKYSSSYFWIPHSPEYDAAYIKKHPGYLIEEDLLDDLTSIETAAEILPNGARIYCGDATAINEIITQMRLYGHKNYAISCIYALAGNENQLPCAGNFTNNENTLPIKASPQKKTNIDLKPRRIKRELLIEKIKDHISQLLGYAAAISLALTLIMTIILLITNKSISSSKTELATLTADTSTTPEEIIEKFKEISEMNLKTNRRFDNLFLAFCKELEKIESRPLINQIYYDKNKLLTIKLKGTSKPAFDAIKNITSDRISVRSGAITTINNETTIDVNILAK